MAEPNSLRQQLAAVRRELELARNDTEPLRHQLAAVGRELGAARNDTEPLRQQLAAVGRELGAARNDYDQLRQQLVSVGLELHAVRNENRLLRLQAGSLYEANRKRAGVDDVTIETTQHVDPVVASSRHRKQRSDMWFFFHLPKTAGGTLCAGLLKNSTVMWPLAAGEYFPSGYALEVLPSRMIWFGGHTSFGLHRLYNARSQYITVLREPRDRLISEFFYFHAGPDASIPYADCLPAFCRYVETRAHLNYYSYMFSEFCFEKEAALMGDKWDGSPEAAFSLLIRRNRLANHVTDSVPFERVDAEKTFEQAKQNLKDLFVFVGIYEQLDETVVHLHDRLGLRIDLDLRLHVTTSRPQLSDLPAHIQVMLNDKTKLDRELYNSVLSRNNSCSQRDV